MPSKSPPKTSIQPEPRGARRKRETRFRLLDAAMQLIGEKGIYGVAINEITNAADVGFGTFFNHFKSKEAIYAAAAERVFEEFAERLELLTARISDPAEVVSVSVRQSVLRAQNEPVWAKFQVRAGLSRYGVDRRLNRRLLEDIKKGIDAGRFSNRDVLISFLAIRGIVLYSINAIVYEVDLGYSLRSLPERVASSALRILGINDREAEEISRRRLPKSSASQP
jgi:AcrR family transcriptional regulator